MMWQIADLYVEVQEKKMIFVKLQSTKRVPGGNRLLWLRQLMLRMVAVWKLDSTRIIRTKVRSWCRQAMPRTRLKWFNSAKQMRWNRWKSKLVRSNATGLERMLKYWQIGQLTIKRGILLRVMWNRVSTKMNCLRSDPEDKAKSEVYGC